MIKGIIVSQQDLRDRANERKQNEQYQVHLEYLREKDDERRKYLYYYIYIIYIIVYI